jgi:hypothetical protein
VGVDDDCVVEVEGSKVTGGGLGDLDIYHARLSGASGHVGQNAAYIL